MKKSIVILDSGIGGLHILAACKKLIPHGKFVYYADNLNAPYGNKTQKQLQKIACKLVKKIIANHNPQIIVLACNTLTVNAIKFLRKRFPHQTFVGTEPALKQARIYGGNTIILATPSTQKQFYFLNKKITHELKKEHKNLDLPFFNDGKIFRVVVPNLASRIEQNLNNLNRLQPQLNSILCRTKFQTASNLVIGCTHYLAIKTQLQTALPEVKIFDNSLAIAKRVLQLLSSETTSPSAVPKFFCTANQKTYLIRIKKYFNKISN